MKELPKRKTPLDPDKMRKLPPMNVRSFFAVNPYTPPEEEQKEDKEQPKK